MQTRISSQEVQTWRSANGHSFEGEFISSADGQVQLRGTDGTVVAVPISVLDAESQARVTALASGVPLEGLTPETAVYAHKGNGYEYMVGDAKDNEYIQIRLYDGPTLIPHYGVIPVRMNLKKVIETDDKPRQQSVDLKEIVLEDEKTSGARFRFTYEGGVEVVLETRNLSNGVGLHRYIDNIPAGLPPYVLEVRAVYPALLEYDTADKLYKGILSEEGVAFPQLAAFLKDYQITAINRKETVSFGFHESPKGLKGQEMILETPSNKDIVFQVVGIRGEIGASFYGGKKAIEGFGLNLKNPMKEGEEKPEFQIMLK
jgi:hypothetical protein